VSTAPDPTAEADGSGTAPDPQRLGGIGWARRTRGALTGAERRRLTGEITRALASTMAGRVKLALGRLPAGAADLDLADFRPPDSALAREAEEACREQSPAVAGHGHRTYVFGRALAALDREPLDTELFYVAALLHDAGIEQPVAGEDFTLRSAQRAVDCAHAGGLAEHQAELIADAITAHATPGITPARDGTLGYYVQSGATADLAGIRLWDLPKPLVTGAIELHPRHGVQKGVQKLIREEARAVPEGRFALLVRCGFILSVKVAPLRD
jgi:hypothetical protein